MVVNTTAKTIVPSLEEVYSLPLASWKHHQLIMLVSIKDTTTITIKVNINPTTKEVTREEVGQDLLKEVERLMVYLPTLQQVWAHYQFLLPQV